LAWVQQLSEDRRESRQIPATTEGFPSEAGDPPERVGAATAWDDAINVRIAGLAADVERLRTECIDDLWNDSLAARIEQLKHDVDDLGAQTTEPSLQRPTENLP
jgi:hypothetical protein